MKTEDVQPKANEAEIKIIRENLEHAVKRWLSELQQMARDAPLARYAGDKALAQRLAGAASNLSKAIEWAKSAEVNAEGPA